MDISVFIDYNVTHHMRRAKQGYVFDIHAVFYELKQRINDESVGEETKSVMVEILERISVSSTLAKKVLPIKHADPCEAVQLLLNEVRLGKLSSFSNFILVSMFSTLQSDRALAKRAIGIGVGRPPDPYKREEDERYAMLVLYYYEKTGVLTSNRETEGAFLLAAAHVNRVDEPTDKQVRAARYAWETQEKAARLKWDALCKSFGYEGKKPIPVENYKISIWLDKTRLQ